MNIDPYQEGDLHEIGSWRKLLVGFPLYSVFWGCWNKVPQTNWVKQQEVVSQSWRLEGQGQGVSRAALLLKPAEGSWVKL